MTTTTEIPNNNNNSSLSDEKMKRKKNNCDDDENCNNCDTNKEIQQQQRKKTKFLVDVVEDDDNDEMDQKNNNNQQQDQIVFVNDPNDMMESIYNEDVQLVVWKRPTLPNFITKLVSTKSSSEIINSSSLPSYYGKVTPTNVIELMKEKLILSKEDNDNTILSNDDTEELIMDVAKLVKVFDTIVNGNEQDDEDDDGSLFPKCDIHVRLEVLEDNGCAFWHQDTVPLRMVTTYRGPCTEYVSPKVSQVTLDHRQYDSQHATSFTHYDVALFKGRKFMDDDDEDEDDDDEDEDDPDVVIAGSGIVHRSPRIEGTGETRLVLVLDIPAEFHEEEEENYDGEGNKMTEKEEEEK